MLLRELIDRVVELQDYVADGRQAAEELALMRARMDIVLRLHVGYVVRVRKGDYDCTYKITPNGKGGVALVPYHDPLPLPEHVLDLVFRPTHDLPMRLAEVAS